MINLPPSRQHPMLLLLFVGSGCAALIYEIVWFQLIQLVIGLTTVSLGLVLGVFMGGMCLGSLILPRLISPKHNPLRVYALLEFGIGVSGVVLLFVVPRVAELYAAHAGSGYSGTLMRAGLAAFCLLPPTMLMGATLPAIARRIEGTREGVAWLGLFYGGNILGAVFGCLYAGFYLLRVHDMATATMAAAAINAAVALLALALSMKMAFNGDRTDSPTSSGPLVPGPAVQARKPEEAGSAIGSLARVWPVHLAIALSGMAALGAEVVWTRQLSLLMGGTVYTFSLILAAFLVGLGIGSGAGSLLARTLARPRLALGGCQLLLMAAVTWSAVMIARSLPYWPIDPALSTSPWFNFQLDFVRSLWVVLPAAILWGASFPLALAAVASPGRDPGRLVGGVYAANTVGAIVGALAFSLFIIPKAGSQTAGQMLIVISAASAWLALGLPHDLSLRQTGRYWLALRTALAAAITAALAGAFLRSVSPVPWGLVAYGRWMQTYTGRLVPGLTGEKNVPADGSSPDIYCTYVGEGLNGTIAVTKWTSGARNFHSAGKVQASSEPRDMRLQRMLGHLSALLHARPESVLVVACGAGVTAGTFVTHPETKRIVLCDIEPLVPKVVAPMFAHENHNIVGDPRTQVVSDDGRHFIRTTQEKFDIITSDPIDPWVKGCAALNTIEYYEMCKAHLKPGGVMSLWIPLYESDAQSVKSVVATFFQVFPHGVLWSNDDNGSGYDAVLFGKAGPIRIDLDQLQARLDRPDHDRVKQSLAEVGFPSVMDLMATYAGRAHDLQPWMYDAQINTDRNLRLQYLAGWAVNSFHGPEILSEILQYREFPQGLFVGSEAQKQQLSARWRKRAQAAVPSTNGRLVLSRSP